VSITRRAFFRDAILGASALLGRTSSCTLVRHGKLQIHQVLFDARQPDALEFAATAHRMGASMRAIRGHVPDRCFEDLCVQWRTKRTAVAGITDLRSLFLLQAMAADAGVRPVLRIHHRASRGATAHEAFGAAAYSSMSDQCLAGSGDRWASEAARLVLSLPASTAGAPQQTGNLDEANQQALGSRALVTWVMA
jgi:hypothetical protein